MTYLSTYAVKVIKMAFVLALDDRLFCHRLCCTGEFRLSYFAENTDSFIDGASILSSKINREGRHTMAAPPFRRFPTLIISSAL